MKKIFVKFVDMNGKGLFKWLNEILADCYEIIEVDNNPDYVFYSVFGCEHIKYDCVRIFYSGENCRADFNFCDYAITFDYLDFEDRHLRYPLYLFYDSFKQNLVSKRLDSNYTNRKFCSFVVSNGTSDSMRNAVFEALNTYKRVDSGGKYQNNVGFFVKDKQEFISKYKFNIAFENSYTNGYITEKLFDAKAADCIPIYWGGAAREIKSWLNPKAFIDFYNFKDVLELVEFVKYLDSNDSAYLEMLNEPLVLDITHKEKMDHLAREFFINIFSKPIDLAYKRGFGQWRLNVENRYKRYQRARNLANKITDTLRFRFR